MRTVEVHGSTVGPFILRGELGAGAMGIVYRALDTNLRREVALKVLKRSPQPQPNEVTRFRIETWAASRLRHPNIVRIYTVGVERGMHYYTMEYVRGRPLSALIDSRELTTREAVTLVVQLGHALDYAHQRGVIHRDIKPANILIDEAGAPHLIDFGLARLCDLNLALTQSGEMLGTPLYMSPEQVEGLAPVGPASDQYALGSVLYELLAGQPPFRQAGLVDGLRAILEQEHVPLRTSRPDLPRDLEAICAMTLARQPSDRYDSVSELAHALQRWLDRRPLRARATVLLRRAWRCVHRRRPPREPVPSG